MILWRNNHFYCFNINPRFPPFLLYVMCKSGVTFVRRCFRDNNQYVRHQKSRILEIYAPRHGEPYKIFFKRNPKSIWASAQNNKPSLSAWKVCSSAVQCAFRAVHLKYPWTYDMRHWFICHCAGHTVCLRGVSRMLKC